MFSRIRIKNFKSIDDLTIDFSYAEGKAPNNYEDSNTLAFLEPNKNNKDRKIPVLAIYGANASGKSNFVDCLFTYYDIISRGLLPEDFKPNKLKFTGSSSDKTIIEIEFFINSQKIGYLLEYNWLSITNEVFRVNDKVIFEVKNQRLTIDKSLETKNYKSDRFDEMYRVRCLKIENKVIGQKNTLLRFLVEEFPGLNDDLTQTVNYFASYVAIGKNNNLNPITSATVLTDLKGYNIQSAFSEIIKIMKKINIDIDKMEIFKLNKKDDLQKDLPSELFGLVSYHKNENGKLVPFDFISDESLGTKLAFGLIGPILKTLEIGGVLIVDEIDKSLHPLILIPLIKMFKDKNINKNNSQLIFTSHTTEILDDEDFRVSEFLFMNKSQKKGTFARRLSDFEKARNDVKFRKRYLKGFYLGIPYPTL